MLLLSGRWRTPGWCLLMAGDEGNDDDASPTGTGCVL